MLFLSLVLVVSYDVADVIRLYKMMSRWLTRQRLRDLMVTDGDYCHCSIFYDLELSTIEAFIQSSFEVDSSRSVNWRPVLIQNPPCHYIYTNNLVSMKLSTITFKSIKSYPPFPTFQKKYTYLTFRLRRLRLRPSSPTISVYNFELYCADCLMWRAFCCACVCQLFTFIDWLHCLICVLFEHSLSIAYITWWTFN